MDYLSAMVTNPAHHGQSENVGTEILKPLLVLPASRVESQPGSHGTTAGFYTINRVAFRRAKFRLPKGWRAVK